METSFQELKGCWRENSWELGLLGDGATHPASSSPTLISDYLDSDYSNYWELKLLGLRLLEVLELLRTQTTLRWSNSPFTSFDLTSKNIKTSHHESCVALIFIATIVFLIGIINFITINFTIVVIILIKLPSLLWSDMAGCITELVCSPSSSLEEGNLQVGLAL